MSSKDTPSSGSGSGSSNKQSSSSSGHSHSSGTLPPSSQEEEEQEEVKNVWGQLFSLDDQRFRPYDLEAEEMVFGRGDECDYTFKMESTDGLKLNQLSTRHFMIKRRNEHGQLCIYITDLSSNGTFLNQDRLSKNEDCPLSSGDIISLVLPKYKAFHFVNSETASRMQQDLPYELKQKYRIEPFVLGTGSVGTVHRGYVKGSYQRVAVKVIKRNRSLQMVADIKYEAAIMTQLKHVNIVDMLDVFESEESVYIILEFISGGDLFTHIKDNGALSENIAKLWFEQILNAVSYLHSKNVIHRDLKPENILINKTDDKKLENFTLKVADFNLSRFVSNDSLVKTLVGTPMYLAPEVIDPLSSGYDSRVDCWSLGCILFVLLGGYTPFNPDDELHKNIRAGKMCFIANYWENVSTTAIDLIRQMMKVNREKRLNVDKALQHQWFSATSSKRSSEKDEQITKKVRIEE